MFRSVLGSVLFSCRGSLLVCAPPPALRAAVSARTFATQAEAISPTKLRQFMQKNENRRKQALKEKAKDFRRVSGGRKETPAQYNKRKAKETAAREAAWAEHGGEHNFQVHQAKLRLNFWFSLKNLKGDLFLQNELVKNGGRIRLDTLLKFPALQDNRVTFEQLYSAAEQSRLVEVEEDDTGAVWYRPAGIEALEGGGFSRRHFLHQVNTKLKTKDAPKGVGLPRFCWAPEAVSLRSSARTIQAGVEALRRDLKEHASANAARAKQGASPGEGAASGSPPPFPLVLGFDVEYATVQQGGRQLPALVQLASDKRVELLWLDKLPNHGAGDPPLALVELLQDPAVVKVGAGATSDAAELERFWALPELSLGGVLDLADLSLQCKSPPPNPTVPEGEGGLMALTARWVSRHLPKKKFAGHGNISKRSHWRAKYMTKMMRQYAADDVAAGLAVFRSMEGTLGAEHGADIYACIPARRWSTGEGANGWEEETAGPDDDGVVFKDSSEAEDTRGGQAG